MKKISAIGFALLMVFAVFVPFASANDGSKETKGYLYVDLACRSPQIGGEFSIAPVVVSAPFTDAARVDKGFVDAYVKYMGPVEVKQFLPQGQFDMQVEPGTYILAMQDGNGGQPEFALVTLGAGEKETVVFLGHGISGITEVKKTVITVTEATYGAQRTVVDHEAYTETVTDVAAYDEFVPATYKPCVHYVATVPAVPAVPAHEHKLGDYEKDGHGFSTHYDYVGAGNGEYVKDTTPFTHYDYVGHEHHAATPAIPAVPGHYEHANDGVDVPAHTVHHEAETHTVFHPAVTHIEGTFVDVKAEVQALLDGGQQTMVFDNRPNPGGIFDAVGGNLMKTIADPAYGQVKSVHIVYTVDGGEPQTVDKQEYEVFTLA